MSFKSLVIDHMVSNGMFPDQAEKVFQEMEKDEDCLSSIRWNDHEDFYPESMTTIVTMITNAWCRPMFAGGEIK